MNTERFLVVVKGTKAEAIAAAMSRGLGVELVCFETRANEVEFYVYATRAAVAAWFGEPAEVIPGLGYPSGCCLFYQEA